MNDLKLVVEAFMAGHEDRASRILKHIMEQKVHSLINESMLGNVITTPTLSVANNGEDLSNVYVTKNIPKRKKKLPTLKKNVYGTGLAPGNNSGDSGDGGGDGGGGGE